MSTITLYSYFALPKKERDDPKFNEKWEKITLISPMTGTQVEFWGHIAEIYGEDDHDCFNNLMCNKCKEEYPCKCGNADHSCKDHYPMFCPDVCCGVCGDEFD